MFTLIKEIYKNYRYCQRADRIGPDLLFTHWKLYFRSSMVKMCKQKFRHFADSASMRPGSYVVGPSRVRIGERVIIRPGCMLFGESELDTAITIEDDVMLGSGVHIYISDHKFESRDIPIIDQGYTPDEVVTLKRGCWIGANAIILKGVTIGENAVVGAGSIVTKSIPDGAIAVGSPAVVKKQII